MNKLIYIFKIVRKLCKLVFLTGDRQFFLIFVTYFKNHQKEINLNSDKSFNKTRFFLQFDC